jgi:hypothetical protein
VTIAARMRSHWFVVLLPALLLIEYGFARSTDWTSDRVAEAAILFDLCLFVPLLYLLCYRQSLSVRALLVRSAALCLAGIYIASLLVPPEGQVLLDDLSLLRPAGLVVLALIELKLLIELVKLVFSGRTTAEEIAARSGAPEWVARLMMLEARFWKALWALIRR